jgi:hypothetical protein
MASINASTSGAGGVITTADNTGILNLQTAGTNAVTVDASQNVGIGTTSPSTYSAKFAIKTSDQDVIGFVGGTTYGMRFGANSSFAVIDGVDAATGTSAYNPLCMRGSQLLFNTAGTERMRIDSSGNVMVGTTSSSRKFQVKGIVGYEQISGGTNVWEAYQNTDNTYRLNYNGSGSDEFILYTNGNYLFTGSNVSDIRLKQDIDFETPQLANILALTPKTYKFKPIETQSGEIGTTSGVKHGFIAQDILEVVPELVNGNPLNENEILGVDYNGIVAMCVKAIQEQQTIINDLKARIETLEAK